MSAPSENMPIVVTSARSKPLLQPGNAGLELRKLRKVSKLVNSSLTLSASARRFSIILRLGSLGVSAI